MDIITGTHIVDLYGTEWQVEKEFGYVYFQHLHSSLTGYGKTRVDAEINMLEMAKEIFDMYVGISPDQLTERAGELRDLLLRLPLTGLS